MTSHRTGFARSVNKAKESRQEADARVATHGRSFWILDNVFNTHGDIDKVVEVLGGRPSMARC